MLDKIIHEFADNGKYNFQGYTYTDVRDLFYVLCLSQNYDNLTTSATTLSFASNDYVYQLVNGVSEWKLFNANEKDNRYLADCSAIILNQNTFFKSKKYNIFLDDDELNLIKPRYLHSIVKMMVDTHFNYFTQEVDFDKRSQLIVIDNLISISNTFRDKDLITIFKKARELINNQHSIDFKIENFLYDDITESPIFWDIVYP